MMGAIDAHNFRRQSGKGMRAMENVWVSNDAKDRIFINIISWVVINMFLAKKTFVWGWGREADSGRIPSCGCKKMPHREPTLS